MSSSAKNVISNLLKILGICLVLFSGYILLRLFHDPLKQEIRYTISTLQSKKVELTPPDTDFAIVIDKIGASSVIIPNVDPSNSSAYQKALRDGVAHAKSTKFPGQAGNIFLFAHSSADLLTAERYNSVFYLMHYLALGDQIKIWYQNVEHDYTVTDKKIVAPSDTKYLITSGDKESLTLMTCWPPGTTLQRLIIIAKPN